MKIDRSIMISIENRKNMTKVETNLLFHNDSKTIKSIDELAKNTRFIFFIFNFFIITNKTFFIHSTRWEIVPKRLFIDKSTKLTNDSSTVFFVLPNVNLEFLKWGKTNEEKLRSQNERRIRLTVFTQLWRWTKKRKIWRNIEIDVICWFKVNRTFRRQIFRCSTFNNNFISHDDEFDLLNKNLNERKRDSATRRKRRRRRRKLDGENRNWLLIRLSEIRRIKTFSSSVSRWGTIFIFSLFFSLSQLNFFQLRSSEDVRRLEAKNKTNRSSTMRKIIVFSLLKLNKLFLVESFLLCVSDGFFFFFFLSCFSVAVIWHFDRINENDDLFNTDDTRNSSFYNGKTRKRKDKSRWRKKNYRETFFFSDSIIRRETHVEYASVDFHINLIVTRGREKKTEDRHWRTINVSRTDQWENLFHQ